MQSTSTLFDGYNIPFLTPQPCLLTFGHTYFQCKDFTENSEFLTYNYKLYDNVNALYKWKGIIIVIPTWTDVHTLVLSKKGFNKMLNIIL